MRLTLNKIIGNNVKNLRTYANITQGKLANMLSVSISTMSLYEKGERQIPNESLLTLSRILNVKIDDLFTSSAFELDKDSVVYFENFTIGSSTIISSGETRVANPHSMYFTLKDTNGDTLVFLRSTEITEGLMLVSESHIMNKLDHIDANSLKDKRLFLTTISKFGRIDGKNITYTFTDYNGHKFVMKNKAMFIYYGFLVARIKHVVKTEEFFFELKP